jgi:fructokinase
MERRFDVVGLGELLIDFTDAGRSANGQRLFEQNPGGAPPNLLTAVSHAGGKAAFIGKVGNDMHGLFLKETLEKEGIDTSGLIVARDVFTTLAFVALEPDGEREFSFARKPGADTMLRFDEVNQEILKSTKVFHTGSLSLTDDPCRTATYESVKLAKAAGAVISYDPNYRASLWNSEAEAVKGMLSLVTTADLMKVSDEESVLLTGEKDYHKAAEKLLSMGPTVVAVTLGADGVYAASKNGFSVTVPGFKVKAVDATGAGDSFWGGFLSQFVRAGKKPSELTEQDLTEFTKFGNATASLCVQKRGGIPSIPYEADIKKVLS